MSWGLSQAPWGLVVSNEGSIFFWGGALSPHSSLSLGLAVSRFTGKKSDRAPREPQTLGMSVGSGAEGIEVSGGARIQHSGFSFGFFSFRLALALTAQNKQGS